MKEYRKEMESYEYSDEIVVCFENYEYEKSIERRLWKKWKNR